MFSYRSYYYHKNGRLMMRRKFLGIWWDYEPFENREIAIQQKLNKLVHEAEAECMKLNLLQEEKYRIEQDILHARGEKPGQSQEQRVKMKLRPIRHKMKTIADASWTELVKLFGGGRTMAETISGIPGAKLRQVNGYQVGDQAFEETDGEYVGAKNFPVQPESRSQQNKKGNNNQQQNQQK